MRNNRHFTDALFEEFDYFNDEVDNLLTEDLDTMLKYYNNLQNWDKQELLKFLTKDPTWNETKEQGQYSKWILDKLNRNLLNNSHLGHLHDALKRFEDNKKYLKNKDINKFKSVQEIDTYLNDDNNYNELSHSQIVRQHRRDKQKVDLGNEAELIYEDSNWEIWIPKTYAASCKLGQGSKWCTASTETSEYFDDYSRVGNLYIILNKHNEKEKYQFHVHSGSYMNINDEEINLLYLCEREDTKNWMRALRQYDCYFDDSCGSFKDLINISQKINSLEIIKYPAQKDIIEDFKKSISNFDVDGEQTKEELSKIKNIKLEIENSVEKLEPYAFNNITWINRVTFDKHSNIKSIGSGAFEGCYNITEVEMPYSITEIGDDAFSWCSSLKNIQIPKNTKAIGSYAFSWCHSLESIVIPPSVTSIKQYTFLHCKSLKEVIIPNSVINIEHNAFVGCTSLRKLIIPDSVTRIGTHVFYNCNNLSIIIGDGVTSIEKDAFDRCTNLLIKTSNPYVINYCIENDIKYEKID